MKVALVHDYLTEFGGAERVLEAIHELWPSAPVFTSIWDKSILLHSDILSTQKKELDWDIRPSRISMLPLVSKVAKAFTFFMPLVFENMDLREYDVVISDGTIWSKGVLTTPEQLHIHYCHTPPRWLYGYPGETDRRRLWYLQPILKPLDNWLRVWDFESAQRPDFIVANSQTVAERIKKFWRREAKIIYPSVSMKLETGGWKLEKKLEARSSKSSLKYPDSSPASSIKLPASYFLVVSRLSAYKNVDLAIEACIKLNLPLVVVGEGREEKRLRALASKNVKFMNFVEDSELSKFYKNCRALIFPVSDEDFGIVPVEAMSFGKPVIALRSGGVQETVIEGKTGVFFNESTVESLTKAIQQFDHLTIDPSDCVQQSQKFSKATFQKEFKNFVEEKLREFKNSSKMSQL